MAPANHEDGYAAPRRLIFQPGVDRAGENVRWNDLLHMGPPAFSKGETPSLCEDIENDYAHAERKPD